MLRSEVDLVKKAGDFASASEFANWLISHSLVDFTRCRIWAVRRFYEKKIKEGLNKMDALTCASIEYCMPEDTVKNAVYRNKDL